MDNVFEYNDITAFHPGYYVSDVINDMGISQAEFAVRMGTSGKTLSQLVNGQINISNDLAKKLSAMLGTSSELWLNLQSSYDQKLIEIQQAKDNDEQKEIASLIDYSYFEAVCGLESVKKIAQKVSNLCKFFKVSDLRIMLQPDFLVDIELSDSKSVINSRAWVQTAINISKNIETKTFNVERLKSCLPELRSLTVKSPEVFVPRIGNLFSECGIAFVMLPHLKNSHIDSAVKWVSNDRVVLAMSDKCLYSDSFWISLLRNVKKILQQKVKTVFVCSCDGKNAAADYYDENEKYAVDFLVPRSTLKKFAPDKSTTDEEIKEFANSIGIHPSIVFSRLQKDKIISSARKNVLIEKYVIDI
ncbi:MAG: HigA family addiction module antitoxin [Saccharofermentans sp.]|nr:HigA family addiction module antitoxin [Saccharofermentans sp.]